jgi:hypothetical protein
MRGLGAVIYERKTSAQFFPGPGGRDRAAPRLATAALMPTVLVPAAVYHTAGRWVARGRAAYQRRLAAFADLAERLDALAAERARPSWLRLAG